MDSAQPINDQKPPFLARLLAEAKRLIVIVVVAALLAIAGKYYCCDRLDEEIRGRVENLLRNHYRGLTVKVQRARRVAGRGIEIRGITIAEGGPGAPVLARIDEILAECDTRLPDFLTKPLRIKALRVHRLQLRGERKPTGVWNISHLLPLPPCQSETPPIATISDASLEIVDPDQPASTGWSLHKVELTVTPVTAPPSDNMLLRVRGTASGDRLERMEIDGLIEPKTALWALRGAVEGLEFSPRLRAALPRELSHTLTPLSSIRGRTYFGFRVERGLNWQESGVHRAAPATANGPDLQFAVHGKISEGRVDDARLPEALTDVEADIHCDNGGLVIKDLSARCGSARIELDASLVGFRGAQPIEIDLDARHLDLESMPTQAMPPAARQLWENFQPRGQANIVGRLHFDGHAWRPDLAIECNDLSVAYERFPYRLTDGSGKIVIQPDSISVRLTALAGGQPIHCRADVRHPGRDFTGWIEVESEGPVPIDDKLLAAIEPARRQLVQSFRPRGAASFWARYERQAPGAPLRRRMSIDLNDCSIRHDRFPYPIDRVSGQLEMTDNQWIFRKLAGRNDSATIVGEGSWETARPTGSELLLRFTATDVPLADELRQALSPAAQRLWAGLRPRGNIDHVLVELKFAAAARQWSVDVQANKAFASQTADNRPLSLEPAWFPYRLDNLTGGFHYAIGQVRLSNLHAVRGPATIAADGNCRMLPDGSCRLELTKLAADRLEMDQELLAAMPAGLAQSVGRIPIEGPVNLIGSLGITVPGPGGGSSEVDWNLSLDIENGRLLSGTPIEHIHGSVWLNGRQGGEGLYSRGELKVDSATIRNVHLSGLEGPFWFDERRLVFGALAGSDSRDRLPRQITARVFGGQLSLDGELSIRGDGGFQMQAAVDNADLAEIARQIAPHQRGLSGRVYAVANFGGSLHAMHTWRGNGQVRLRDADIYELPVMVTLLSLLSVKRPDRTAFTTSDVEFRVEGDDLAFDRIDFSGDAISLKGKGRMNGQREIDLKFYPILGREEHQLPIFRPLLGETGREFMLVEVTGTLDRQQVRRTVFPRIDAQVQQLFPELARDDLEAPNLPIMSLPREAWNRLRAGPWR
jgi:hypothetical protein